LLTSRSTYSLQPTVYSLLNVFLPHPFRLRVRPSRPFRPEPIRVLKFSELRPLQPAWMYGDLDVTTKISGYQNRPVQVGAGKSVSGARDAAVSPADKTTSGSPVHITDQARQLAALEQAVQGAPIVNEARVAAVRSAIEEGRYEVEPERIADKMLRMDRDLRASEK
jgi:negative regulator of flagellin synthesis FlgM